MVDSVDVDFLTVDALTALPRKTTVRTATLAQLKLFLIRHVSSDRYKDAFRYNEAVGRSYSSGGDGGEAVKRIARARSIHFVVQVHCITIR